ncbi:hypothetical protein ACWD0J_05135 [Streptomyces sp. NPDC003011]
MPTGTDDNGVYVTPANAPHAPVDRVDVTLLPGADAGAVEAALRRAVRQSPLAGDTNGRRYGWREPPAGRYCGWSRRRP